MKRKVLMIDPPSGWRYGFPKELTVDGTQTVTEWLVDNGYPKLLIEKLGEHFYCRHWEEEVDVEEDKTSSYDKLGPGEAYTEGYDFT